MGSCRLVVPSTESLERKIRKKSKRERERERERERKTTQKRKAKGSTENKGNLQI